MAIVINTGKEPEKKQVVEQVKQEQPEQTLEEQLVALIGTKNVDKAASLASKIEDAKAVVKALESDYKPIADAIQTVIADAELPPTKKLLLKSEAGTTLEIAALRKSTTISDKEALYHKLEESKEGLYFELSAVSLTECKQYVPVKGNVGTIYQEGYGKTRTLKFKL